MRASRGGHHIPEHTVLRRYDRSKEMLITTYSKLSDYLYVFDNSNGDARLILTKEKDNKAKIIKEEIVENIFGASRF
jgi:predicted ABC-type ATPase